MWRVVSSMIVMAALGAPAERAWAADANKDEPSARRCAAERAATIDEVVRARDPLARRLLEYGIKRSPTFNGLLDTLAHSDVIVYVQIEATPAGARGRPNGRMLFVTAQGGVRYLRIILQPGTTSESELMQRHLDLVGMLAHELQHAVEVATASGVISPDDMAHLYQTIGIQVGPREFDTAAANVAGRQVVKELRARDWAIACGA